MIHDICPGAKPFNGCHCARVVWWFFIKQMPQVIKTGLAEKRFTKDTYGELFDLADKIYNANNLGASSPAVVAAVTPVSLDETQPAIPYPVEAATFRGGRGGRGRGGRGGGRGGQSRGGGQSSQPSSAAPASSSSKKDDNQDLPKNLCSNHKKHKKKAYHCKDPFVCEWASFIIPKDK